MIFIGIMLLSACGGGAAKKEQERNLKRQSATQRLDNSQRDTEKMFNEKEMK